MAEGIYTRGGRTHLLPVFSVEAVYTAFCDTYGRDFRFTGESHPMWELNYVIQGSCGVTSGPDVYSLSAGDLVIHRPGVFHTAWADEKAVSVMTISFTGTGPEDMLRGGKYIPKEQEKALIGLLQEQVRTGRDSELDKARLRALLESLLLFLAESRHRPERENTRFTAMAEYMQENVMRNLTMPELEQKFGLSATAIRSIYHRYTGVSPLEYFYTLRTTAAAALLREGLTVGETAEKMDFSSPAYFSAFFKKRTGQSPTDVRK